jgi:methyl-accepting chemotaxis protein
VNTAVTDMDKVTQQNAANAEESASASEEMNAQAEQMKGMVGELIALVGKKGTSENGQDLSAARNTKPVIHRARALPISGQETAYANGLISGKAKEVDPDAVIPMDDSDFKDF